VPSDATPGKPGWASCVGKGRLPVLGIRACVGVLLGTWPLAGPASCGRRLREGECGVVVAECRPCGLAAAPVGAGKMGCIAKAAFSTGAQLAPPFSPAPSTTTGQLRYGH